MVTENIINVLEDAIFMTFQRKR